MAEIIPFFTSYSEGEMPLTYLISYDILAGINTETHAGLLIAERLEHVTTY